MAASGYTPILIYASGTATNVPLAANLTSSASGAELALNYADGKLFYKDSGGVVQVLASKAGNINVASFQTSLGGLTPSTATTGVVTLAGTLNTSSGGTGLTSYTAGDLPYYATGTALSKLGIGTNGQILTSSGTAPQWSTLSGVAVTTFSAGTTGFTPNSATSGAVTLAGTLATTNGGTGLTSFTANGVVYASSTSALTTGSALTFDGTNLGLGVTPSAYNTSGSTFQINRGTTFSADINSTYISNNASNLQQKYLFTGNFAVSYALDSALGSHKWFTAPSGTAGNAITFTQAMTLGADGTLGVGVTNAVNADGNLAVAGSIGTGQGTANTVSQINIWETTSGNKAGLWFGAMTNSNVGVIGSRTGSGAIAFQTYNGSWGERARIDSNGNLLVGTTTVGGRLTVDSGSGATGFINISSPALTDANQTLGFSIQDGNHGVFLLKDGTGVNINELLFKEFGGVFKWINANTSAVPMTLDASGNLLVGTTATNAALIQGVSAVINSGGSKIHVGHVSGTITGESYAVFCYNGTAIGTITQSGTTAVLYNVTSDQRLKENIVDAPEFGNVIDSIKVRSYDWKTDQTHQRAGFIAQELVIVAPEAVHQPADPEEMMAVDYSKLVPMLVKEIQDLRKRLAALEAK